MINDPKLLICDEPTGNLDPDTSKEVMDVLDSINKDETKVKPMSDENMRNQEFVKILNDNVDDIDLSNLDDDRVTEYSLKNWVFADNSYPTFE